MRQIILTTFLYTIYLSVSIAQPFSGTIFIDPDIIISTDPSVIVSTTYTGQGSRTVYDRRIPGWTTINAYLFSVVWSDGLTSEVQVNPEFESLEAATTEATKYARIIGQLPYCLRTDVKSIWIHKGTQPFGGGNHSILIHTGQSVLYETDGILEETLVHEATHTSLDASHANAPEWILSQTKDNAFISTYAASNPTTEDIAESFLTWMAVRQCNSRISQQNYNTINQTIPNRINYFNNQSFNMDPVCINPTGIIEIKKGCIYSIHPNPFFTECVLKTNYYLVNATLNIYNSSGQYVKQIKDISGNTITLRREDLITGFYYIQLTEKNKIIAAYKLLIIDN